MYISHSTCRHRGEQAIQRLDSKAMGTLDDGKRSPSRDDISKWTANAMDTLSEQIVKNALRHGVYTWFPDEMDIAGTTRNKTEMDMTKRRQTNKTEIYKTETDETEIYEMETDETETDETEALTNKTTIGN